MEHFLPSGIASACSQLSLSRLLPTEPSLVRCCFSQCIHTQHWCWAVWHLTKLRRPANSLLLAIFVQCLLVDSERQQLKCNANVSPPGSMNGADADQWVPFAFTWIHCWNAAAQHLRFLSFVSMTSIQSRSKAGKSSNVSAEEVLIQILFMSFSYFSRPSGRCVGRAGKPMETTTPTHSSVRRLQQQPKKCQSNREI